MLNRVYTIRDKKNILKYRKRLQKMSITFPEQCIKKAKRIYNTSRTIRKERLLKKIYKPCTELNSITNNSYSGIPILFTQMSILNSTVWFTFAGLMVVKMEVPFLERCSLTFLCNRIIKRVLNRRVPLYNRNFRGGGRR
jgi:hypothetical protein